MSGSSRQWLSSGDGAYFSKVTHLPVEDEPARFDCL